MIQILISSHNDDFDLNSTYLRDAWIISTVSEIWFFEGKDRWVHTICYEPTDFFRQKIKFLRQRLKSEKKDPNFLGPLLPILRLTFLEMFCNFRRFGFKKIDGYFIFIRGVFRSHVGGII